MKRTISTLALTVTLFFLYLHSAGAAQHLPQVDVFSPQGTVKGVRQVSVRFASPMVPFGDPRQLTDPFDIACPIAGTGRWADGKNWIFDFSADLPAGLSCKFSLKPELKDLAGTILTGQRVFTFSTGGPAVIRSRPYDGSTIDEEQIFILTLDAQPEIKSVLENVAFTVEGIANPIGIRLIEGNMREKILLSAGYQRADRGRKPDSEPPLVLIQSKQRFPNNTKVRLIWGKGVKSLTGVSAMQNQVFTYVTRKEFMAEFSCSRENPQAGCIPLLPMNIQFTAPISPKKAGRIILKAVNQKMPAARTGKKKEQAAGSPHGIWKPKFDETDSDVYSVSFPGPFPENTKFIIELPPGLKDDAGRKLVNADQFPLAVGTDGYPPLAKFSGRFGILESKTGALLPVTVRHLEAALDLSALKITPEADQTTTGQISGKVYNIRKDQGKNIQFWLRKVASASRTKSVFTPNPAVKNFLLPKPGGTKAFEVIGIPLGGPGFYIVELESRVLGKALLANDLPMRVQTAALVTNMAAHFKKGRESSLVWVTSLDEAKPVSGADVIIRDCRDKILWQGKTDASGIAFIPKKLPGESELPYCSFKEDEDDHDRFDESYHLSGLQSGLFVTAQSGEDMTFVHSSWNQGIESWRFQVQQEPYLTPTIAHSIFDRTLLRAGETVHMKHILREHTSSGFRFPTKGKLPAKATVTHFGSGQKFEFPLKWDAKGIAETTWSIPREAKLGRYHVALGEHDSGGFRVEVYRIPLMRGSIKAPADPPVKANTVSLHVGVQYLAGGGAGHLPVTLRGEIRPKYLPPFEGYEDFTFANGPVTEGMKRRGEYATEESGEHEDKTVKLPVRHLVLDKTGSQKIQIDRLPQANRPRELLSEIEFADPNGEISTISSRLPLWPSRYLIGIKPDSWAASRESLKFQVAVLDLAGVPVSGAKVRVHLLEQKNYSHRKRLIGGFYAYEHASEIKKIGTICEDKTSARGLLFCEGKAPVSGNVILQAESSDEAGRPTFANRDIWVADKEDWWFDVSDSDRMDLIAEKKRYEPGDRAVFQARMPFREATALISVEREGILDAWVKSITGKEPVIEVPVRASYAPNVFVSALVVRGRSAGIAPTSKVDLGKPAYKLGIGEIAVGWKNHELKLSVVTDAKIYKVRDHMKVKIKAVTAAGQPPAADAEVAVAAVDEGLLELMSNRSWNLLPAMMQKRGTSVKTATAQMQVVGKRHFGLKALPQGGGGGLLSGHDPTREMFDPLLLWKGRITLDRSGEASLDIPLNDSLTSFRIVAVATAGAGWFGSGSTSVRSTQDLMAISGLPPVIREGDRYFAGVTVRNTSGHTMDVALSASVAEMKWVIAPLGIKLAAGESREIGWNATAPFGITKMQWTIEAKDTLSGTTDRIKVTQNVIPATPVRTYQSTITRLDKIFRLDIEKPADAIPGLGGIKTTLKPKLSDGLDGVTDYMKRYPYTCMEQKVSVAVALRDKALWEETMNKLPPHLDAAGLVKFFPSGFSCGSPTLTAYILAVAHEAGWSVPESAKQKMQQGLIRFIEGKWACPTSFSAADLSIRKLAAVEALSRDGKAQAAMLGSISIEPNLWPTSAVIDWFNILRNMPDLPDHEARLKEAEQILRSRLNFQGTTMGFSTEKNDGLWWLMVSPDVNAVRAILSLMHQPDWKEEIPRLAQGALARQKRGHWDLTIANAWGVLAMEKFANTFETEPPSGRTVTTLDHQTQTVNWIADPKGRSDMLAWPQKKSTLSINHAGTGKPWLTISSMAAIPLVKPFTSGYKIRKTLTPVSQKTSNRWTRGDVVRVRLDLEAQADQTWVVVNDPVPAGATILGGGLGRDSQILTADEKKDGWVRPAFEERASDAFRAYYEFVRKGVWHVEYTIRLNAGGTFQLPATRVEAMYFPEMLGEWPNEAMTVVP